MLQKIRYILAAAVLAGVILVCGGAAENLKHYLAEETAGHISAGKNKEVTVVIDAGHGGLDCGKIGVNGAEEKKINLEIAKLIKKFLEEDGVKVIMTRETDERLADHQVDDLEKRVEIMNKSGADLAVSIHQNSYTDASVSGAQVFYHSKSEQGERAAGAIQAGLNELNPQHSKKIKANDTYYILKNTEIPVVIVESGFLSNYEEAEKLMEAEYQEAVAAVVAEGIKEFVF